MVHDAFLKCLKKLDNFSLEKNNNPFSYFTTIIFNVFRDWFKRENKEQIKKNILQDQKDEFSMSGLERVIKAPITPDEKDVIRDKRRLKNNYLY